MAVPSWAAVSVPSPYGGKVNEEAMGLCSCASIPTAMWCDSCCVPKAKWRGKVEAVQRLQQLGVGAGMFQLWLQAAARL
ncbi:hypothetical protein L3X38_025130 [Prunus dulcis]|uniref:Uncharacterized protein n=1 Tax=Prunus dulcis TaxID=3755 RepID=A0AAD4W3S6_PRUDU|nr:hypothetical protein L3X38_025130 [Prunus dulcis]